MDETKQEHKSNGDPNGGPIHQGHPPYWRRAHRDWRIWFMVILMLGAMAIYLMTGGLRGSVNVQPQQTISFPGGN